MNAVLADASFWVGLRNRRDVHHQRAREIAGQLLGSRTPLIVTPLIFAEAHAFFVRSAILREQIIRDCWENPAVQMEEVTPADQRDAIELLRTYEDREFSFCDACSFVVIERMDLRRATSFDQHFRQVGKFDVID